MCFVKSLVHKKTEFDSAFALVKSEKPEPTEEDSSPAEKDVDPC